MAAGHYEALKVGLPADAAREKMETQYAATLAILVKELDSGADLRPTCAVDPNTAAFDRKIYSRGIFDKLRHAQRARLPFAG